MVMVALRSGRSCLTTLPMDRPVRAWMQRATARAVNTMVRCASMASRTRLCIGRARRSVFDMRKDFSTCHRSWYLAMISVAGITSTGTLVT